LFVRSSDGLLPTTPNKEKGRARIERALFQLAFPRTASQNSRVSDICKMRGLEMVDVLCPNCWLLMSIEALPLASVGGANTGWFKTLNASVRKLRLSLSVT
jgi:hypothetical protein